MPINILTYIGQYRVPTQAKPQAARSL